MQYGLIIIVHLPEKIKWFSGFGENSRKKNGSGFGNPLKAPGLAHVAPPPFIGFTKLEGVERMDESTQRRCLTVAQYMLEHQATVRQAAAVFGLSKSSVHKDMCKRLPKIDVRLGRQVAALLEYNKSVRHLRGGEATRRRYQDLHSTSNVL